MNWFVELFTNNSIAHAIIIYSIVIAMGVMLGKVKVKGVSLGATFVLFVGIFMGHLGMSIDTPTLKFVQEFGLILFVFSVGLQVGPSFFSSFKKGGLELNGLAVCIIVLNIVVALTIYYTAGNVQITDLVGILSGAITNTPGLGAAQQTLIETGNADAATLNQSMSMGYAAAYPLGVLGCILSMIIVKVIFRVNVERETKSIDDGSSSLLAPHVASFLVGNKFIYGITIKKLHNIADCNFVISRLKRPDGEIIVPKSDTVIGEGDLLMVVCPAQDEDIFGAIVGPHVDVDWKNDEGPVVARPILVTKREFLGKTLEQLQLRLGYELNATRVNRGGVDLVATPDLSLRIGDRITVVGDIDDINRLAVTMGNSKRHLNEPNIFTIFLGIVLGIIVGSYPFMFPGMSVPMKLGLAGGPLIVAILLGSFGDKLRLSTYTSSSANLMMRELGICLFLASVGIAAGGNFVSTVFNATGARWVLYGFMITIIPLLIVGTIARGKFKLNYCTIMGLLAGSTTDPPALAYANKTTGIDAPAISYSMVYPLAMFLRVISAQILILALA